MVQPVSMVGGGKSEALKQKVSREGIMGPPGDSYYGLALTRSSNLRFLTEEIEGPSVGVSH